ncbi:hypothetical protein HanXRQr2_Chr04g0160271 [Helianthus annuus]|uniref:Uncharacterized protein n=1 Tax=Helianthus annuus TaxID=4232 RepID=A0A9K3NSD7_HELAN|nr:hypothetical protein HanXRQr2_Chr04g0160271 [Helianthus annuus]KAJ0588309.1 hypothetical protein HanIR_Chr04g0173101 [Helianthus annuus]KAJ0930857.1 hypothetical protein HanPSC8_Chr04g0154381 [Helianthus annuus]
MILLKAWPPPVTGETLAKFFQKSNTWKYFYHKCYKYIFNLFSQINFAMILLQNF